MSKTQTRIPTTTNAQRTEDAYLRQLAADAGITLTKRQVSKFRGGYGDLYRAHLARVNQHRAQAHRINSRQLAEALEA